MSLTTFEGDVLVQGRLVANQLTMGGGSVTNASVAALAGIEASKLQHQHQIAYAQPSGQDAAADARVVHVVRGLTGTVVSFRAGAVVKAGADTTVEVDLLKNGASILTDPIELDDGDSNYGLVAAIVASAGLAVGDVLEVEVTLTGTNEPKGVFAALVIREDPQ